MFRKETWWNRISVVLSKIQISLIGIKITINQSPAIYADFVSALILQKREFSRITDFIIT